MRGWPKGKPRKVVQQPTIQPKTEANFNESVGIAGSGGDGMDFAPDERMALYQEAAKQLYPDQVTEIPPDNGETQVTETTGTEKTEKVEEKAEGKASEEPKKEETVPVTEPTEPVQATDKKPEEIKTVPYGALHEERMKRKDLQREVDDARAKMNQLIEDNVKLMTKGTETSGNEYEPVYKGELSEVKMENLRLKTEIDTIKQRFQFDDQEKRQTHLQKLVDDVDKIETDSGRPGFKVIGRHLVLERINQIATEDPDLAASYQNPDGWRKRSEERRVGKECR